VFQEHIFQQNKVGTKKTEKNRIQHCFQLGDMQTIRGQIGKQLVVELA
jgi:hypothetical protein